MLTNHQQQEIIKRVRQLITRRKLTETRVKNHQVDPRVGQRRIQEEMDAFAKFLKDIG